MSLPNIHLALLISATEKDPFETDFNVARCVTRDGLYTVSDRASSNFFSAALANTIPIDSW